MMVHVGDKAPIVKVKIITKSKVNEEFETRQAYQDNDITIFYFFPAAFTGVCTKSSCELRDDIEEFQNLNANIFGISTDMPFTLKKFMEVNNLNYPHLSDWNKDMIKKFGIIDDNFAGGLKGVAKRALFAIQDDIIVYKWIAEHPGKYPPFEELKKQITM